VEKTVKIDGKDVVLKASAYNLVLYRAEFGEDIFVAKNDVFSALTGSQLNLEKIDGLGVAKMVWTMAKTADESIPGFHAWIRTIDDLPVVDLLTDNLELFVSNMSQKTQIKKAADTEPETDEKA
jgi:hypothetical protein